VACLDWRNSSDAGGQRNADAWLAGVIGSLHDLPREAG
jgi:hypothetical protein